MSLENALVKVINEILENRLLSPYPIYADKQDMSKMLGISARTLDRLVLAQRLVEEKHFTRFTENGQKMFVVKLVVAELKPILANIDEIL